MGEPEIRVSDTDRNSVVEALRTHCADGRLTLDEFAERVEVALTAKTQAELDVITSDLPAVLPRTSPAVAVPPRARTPIRSTLAIMSRSDRRGRWRLEGQHNAMAIMGGICLDLREAEIVGDEVVINAMAIMGGIDVIVPEGIQVELTGIAIMGGKESKLRGHKVLPGSPIVRVNVFAFWGGVTVKSRSTREWLRDKHAKKHEMARQVLDDLAAGPPSPWSSHNHSPRPPRPPRPPGGRRRDEPLRSSSRLPEGTVTVLVTDIEGSTEMAEELGDLRFRAVLAKHDDLVRACVDQHQGHVVKGTGDGFLLAFSSARQALLCASELQHAFDDDELSIRMGVHSGEVVRADGDLYGKTVIVASRLAGAATGGEVLVSEITKALTESGGDLRFESSRDVTLKGLSGPQQAWTLDWST